jgi:hypothetical protein
MSYGLPHLAVVFHRCFHAGDSLYSLVAPSVARPRVMRAAWRCNIFLKERSATMAEIPQWWMKGDWFDV